MKFIHILNINKDKLCPLQPIDWPDIIPDFGFYCRSPFCFPIGAMVDNRIAGLVGVSILFFYILDIDNFFSLANKFGRN